MPLPAATKVFETTDPNDSTLFAQPLNLGTAAAGKTPSIDVSGTVAPGQIFPGAPPGGFDVDYYKFDLRAGDILSASVFGAGESLDVLFPNGRLMAASDQAIPLNFPEIFGPTFPPDSPLQTQGNAVLANVIPEDGTYFLRVAPQLSSGSYNIQLRVHRPFLESEPVGTKQVLYLDFDGGIFPASEILPFTPGTVRIDPIDSVLDLLNPGQPGDRDLLIDRILQFVEQDFATLVERGSNGDFDSTGTPGEFAIDIRNSRDDGEMWGLPNVSRIIVGGSPTDVFQPPDSGLLGVAASLDIGNFDTTESAFVLADPQQLFASLIPAGASTSRLDVLARVFASTITHEAGHFFGALHQDFFNNTISIMDQFAGPLQEGVGPDGVFGTEDDNPPGFVDDNYTPFEVFTRGFQHVTETLAFGLSTGTVGGRITGTVFNDINGDGDRDTGEPAFAGIQVFADLNSDGDRDPGEPLAITEADGSFSMTAVPGSYPIRVELPEDTFATTPSSQNVTVARGGSVSDLTFGIERLVTDVTGIKWQDNNGNGTREQNEPGIPGVYVYIDLDNDNQLDITEPQARTAADGSFTLQFPSRPGTYTVREVSAAGFIQTFPEEGEHTVNHDGVTAPINLNFGNRAARDYGDAPAPFPTKEPGAASHGFLAGLMLGNNIDFESDGQRAPDGSATGDDNNGTPLPGGGVIDDEDGIVLSKPLNPDDPIDNQIQVTATNTTGRPARLQGWIDFNNDGDWLDDGEQIVRDRIVATGTQFIDFVVPSGAVRGELLNARFRYGYETGLGPAGAANAGEVEDYQFQIQPQAGLAVDDTFEVARNSVANRLNVVANDFDSLLDPIIDVIPNTAQAIGIVQVDADGRTLLYTPRSGFIGRDTFTYEIVTASGVTETATVTVDVAFQSALPVAVDDIFEVTQGSSNVALDVLRNDVRSIAGNLAIVSVFADSGSSVQIAPGGTALRYTPAPGLTGTDQFTYTISDANGEISTAEVTVNLLPSARADDLVRFDVQPMNDAGQPISVIRAGQQFNLVVRATDLRENVGVNSRGVGSAYMDILYTDGLLSTVPNTVVTPANPFDFQVTFDPTFNVARTGEATVPGLIDEIGAAQDSTSEFQTQHDVFVVRMLARSPGLAEFKTDPADDSFSDVVLLDPASPELTASQIQFGSTNLRVVPADGDFAFAVDDIFPNPQFPAPISQGSQRVPLDVLANDNTGPSGEIEIVTVDQPANGLVRIERGGNSDPSDDVILYTPNQNFVGTDQFRYRIVSLDGITSEATVTVQVGNPVSDDLLEISFDVRQDPADTDSTINVGDNFLLDVFVDDLRPNPVGGAGQDLRGVFAAFFDLVYSSDAVQLVNVPQNTGSNDPAEVLGYQVEFGPNYGNQVFGGDDSFPGIIDEFGAVQNGNDPLGAEPQLFATLTLRAIRSGNAVFLADPAEARPFSDSLLFEPPDRLEISEIRYGSTEVTIANGEAEFTNLANPLDVNDDGFVSPIDALNVINVLNRQGPADLSSLSGEGESASSAVKRLFIDTNGDKRLSPIDALVVINHLNKVSRGAAEGEASDALAAPVAVQSTSPASDAVADAVFEDLSSTDLATGGFDGEAAAAALVYQPTDSSADSDDEDDPLVNLLADDLSNVWG